MFRSVWQRMRSVRHSVKMVCEKRIEFTAYVCCAGVRQRYGIGQSTCGVCRLNMAQPTDTQYCRDTAFARVCFAAMGRRQMVVFVTSERVSE